LFLLAVLVGAETFVDIARFAFFLVKMSQRLAIDGDHISRCPGQCRDPGDEAAPEFFDAEAHFLHPIAPGECRPEVNP